MVDAGLMNGLSFTNHTDQKLMLIVEPIADEYALNPGDMIEMRHPLYLDDRNVIDIQITADAVVVFVPEEVTITRNGEPIEPEGT